MQKICFFEDHFLRSYNDLQKGDQQKIEWVLRLIEEQEKIPSNYFKYLTSPGIYEIRITHNNRHYRICCFFDTQNRLVLINAFSKRSRKTPIRELQKALKLYKRYFHEKAKN